MRVYDGPGASFESSDWRGEACLRSRPDCKEREIGIRPAPRHPDFFQARHRLSSFIRNGGTITGTTGVAGSPKSYAARDIRRRREAPEASDSGKLDSAHRRRIFDRRRKRLPIVPPCFDLSTRRSKPGPVYVRLLLARNGMSIQFRLFSANKKLRMRVR